MTRTVRTDDVEIDLGRGSWTARWPDITGVAGPFSALVETGRHRTRTDAGPGRWEIESGAGYGRAGAWARWIPVADEPSLTLHVPASGSTIVVVVSLPVVGAPGPDRVVPLTGRFELGDGGQIAVEVSCTALGVGRELRSPAVMVAPGTGLLAPRVRLSDAGLATAAVWTPPAS